MFKKILPLFILFFISCTSQKPVIITKKTVEKNPSKVTTIAVNKPEKTVLSKPVLEETQQKITLQDTVKTKKTDVVQTPSIFKDTSKIIKDFDGVIKSMKENGNEDIDTIPRKKPLNLGTIQVLAATTTVKVTKETVLNYINKYKDIAENEMVRFGIPASITIAQGILESGAGTGPLSLQANNHFGIKCHEDWTGESVRYDDDIPDECFRKYDNPSKSFEDHSAFLYTRPWYNSLFKLKKTDYKAWAKGLKAAGYATDTKYPEKLIAIIESYKLTQYDAEVLGIEIKDTVKKPVEIIENVPTEVVENKTIILNSEGTYTVQPKEGLYSIAKKFNLTVDQLKKINNLTDNNLSVGQVLKIK
jgi:flagellum-specific peptidoglycan hydrolase FlgJ